MFRNNYRQRKRQKTKSNQKNYILLIEKRYNKREKNKIVFILKMKRY